MAGSPPFRPPAPFAPPTLGGPAADTTAGTSAPPTLGGQPGDARKGKAAPPTLGEPSSDSRAPAGDSRAATGDSKAPAGAPPTLVEPPDSSEPAVAPPTVGAAPSATSKRGARGPGGPPWRAGPPTPAEFASSTPYDDPHLADSADAIPDDVGVDTDPLNKIVTGGRDSGDAVTSDVPDVELSDTEVAEVLSGRVIPIGAFFGGSQTSAAGSADQAEAPGATFLADIGRIVASWAEDRHLGIMSASGIGIALAVCAAAWFSAGTRTDIIRGVIALWAGYVVLRTGQWLTGRADRVEGEQEDAQAGEDTGAETPAGAAALDASDQGRGEHGRRVRRASAIADVRRTGPAGWLAALGGAVAECGIYAGLAAGAVAERWGAVWTLAAAVLSLVAVRNLMTACSTPPGLSEDSRGLFRRLSAVVLTMPVGGRVLLVGVVAPFWGARAALLALLDWAIISIGYGIAGRAAAGMTARGRNGGQASQGAARSKLVRLRDDGALARALGVMVRGNLMPLPPALLGLAAVSGLALIGLHGLPGVLLIAPAVVMLLAAPGSANPHSGRFDWLVPVLLLGAQCLYLTATGLAARVPGPVIFALIAAIMLRYTDLAWPGRPVQLARRRDPDAEPAERGIALGWEGRMLFAGLTAAIGIAAFAYLALAAYLVALVGVKAVAACFAPRAEARP